MSRQRQEAVFIPGVLENCLGKSARAPMSGILRQSAALIKLSKPGIVLAEVMAGLAGMLLLSAGQAEISVCAPVLMAIALAAGGAAMLNCWFEASSDRQMARLASRTQALETAVPSRVLVIALAMIIAGLALAAVSTTSSALFLLAAGCFSYLLLYTVWLKRRSPWGVLAGCIPGALPPLIGAAAISSNPFTPAPLLLAALIFVWQLPHFWFLALECRDQYVKAGIPALPVTHGVPITNSLTMATVLLLLPLTIAIGRTAPLSTVFTVVATAAGVGFALLCTSCLYDSRNYRLGFRASLVYLLLIFAAICADSLIF
jgi:protoheme IX farnesyltransferase